MSGCQHFGLQAEWARWQERIDVRLLPPICSCGRRPERIPNLMKEVIEAKYADYPACFGEYTCEDFIHCM